MEIITKNRLWQKILPIMRNWILTPQIIQLKYFLIDFERLEFIQKLSVIWQITQPENFIFSNEVFEIQTIYNYIKESPQLSILQTIMRKRELFIITYRYRYMEIKQEIRYVFEEHRHLMRLCDIREEMFQLIRTSPAEIIVELVYHYNIILNELIVYHPRQYNVEIPVALSIEERLNLVLSLYEDGDLLTRRLLFLHDILMNQIITRRNKEIDTLEKNVNLQLILLQQQQIKEFL